MPRPPTSTLFPYTTLFRSHLQQVLIRSLPFASVSPGGFAGGHVKPRRLGVVRLLSRGARKILARSEEHTSELQSRGHLVCRLLLEKKKNVPSIGRGRVLGR